MDFLLDAAFAVFLLAAAAAMAITFLNELRNYLRNQ
jgi:hypothetical protein